MTDLLAISDAVFLDSMIGLAIGLGLALLLLIAAFIAMVWLSFKSLDQSESKPPTDQP